MTPPLLCDLGESVPPSTISNTPNFLHQLPSFPSFLQVSFFPLPTHLPLLSWLLEKMENLARGLPLSTLWAVMAVGHSGGWKSTEFLPSAFWTERRSQDQHVSLLLSLALSSRVPSCRNQSVHSLLAFMPWRGRNELSSSPSPSWATAFSQDTAPCWPSPNNLHSPLRVVPPRLSP